MRVFEAVSRIEKATLSRYAQLRDFTVSPRSHRLRAWARRVGTAMACAIGLWLGVRFCAELDWHSVSRDIRHVGAGAALLFLAPVVANIVHMAGWRALLPSALRPNLRRSMAIFLAAQAGNELGLGVLGESLKVSEFPSQHRAAALKAMIWDNLTALVALIAVVLSISAFLGGVSALHALSRRSAVLTLAALGALPLLIASGRVRLGRSAPQGVFVAFAAHYAGKLWIVAEFALVLALLGSVSVRSSALLGLVSTLASAVGAAIPGQLGVLEAALKGSAASCGLGACTLVSVALLRRLRSVLWVALGAVLFWSLRWGNPPPPARV